MSEQPAAPRPAAGGGKILGMKPATAYLVIGGVALLGAIGFIMWRRYSAATSAATAAAAAPATTTTGTGIDQPGGLSAIQAELEALLQQNAASGTTTGTTTTGTTGTTTGTQTSGPPVIMSLPDGSGGFEQVSFPNQAAVDAWTAWNQAFVNDNHAQAYRSQWNQELTSLGVTRTDGQPLTPPSTTSSNPYDRM